MLSWIPASTSLSVGTPQRPRPSVGPCPPIHARRIGGNRRSHPRRRTRSENRPSAGRHRWVCDPSEVTSVAILPLSRHAQYWGSSRMWVAKANASGNVRSCQSSWGPGTSLGAAPASPLPQTDRGRPSGQRPSHRGRDAIVQSWQGRLVASHQHGGGAMRHRHDALDRRQWASSRSAATAQPHMPSRSRCG